jgi:glycosyltransferase involved in cell wall biosynthesis
MSENSASQIPILIASSLKPTLDTRAWGKLGFSLRETNRYTLNIIGFSAKKEEKISDVTFYSSFANQGSALSRVVSMLRFAQILIRVRPKILICCTYEFLAVASFFKNIIGYKLVYDVQENYVANLDLNPLLSGSKKVKVAKLIRKMEATNAVDLYFLAEQCYRKEMPLKSPFLVLENRYQGQVSEKSQMNFGQKKEFSFLISGTITPAFGVSEAIIWFIEILKKYPKSSLLIMGQVTLPYYQHALEKIAGNNPQITFQTSPFPVSHKAILNAYSEVDFALLPYQNHPAIRDKMPTKLFEAAALGVPVLVSPNPTWLDFLNNFEGGFPIDFLNVESAITQFDQAKLQTFFSEKPSESILWQSQEQTFLQAIETLLS